LQPTTASDPTTGMNLQIMPLGHVEAFSDITIKNTLKIPDEVEIELIPNNVLISVHSDLKIAKENVETYKTIKTNIDSELYRFTMMASSILNWEARYGDVETLAYMVNYPSLKLEKKKIGEGIKVYIITKRDSLESFRFATRSVALPAGVTGQ